MIATNNTGGGGTADFDSRALELKAAVYDHSEYVRIAEREHTRYLAQMFLYSKLGAKLSKSGGQILYWPAVQRQLYVPILLHRPLVILAGYMSRSRGIHWNRR